MQMADAGVALADQRRVAAQMALLAQMHVARLQFAFAVQQFNRADAMWRVDDRINGHTANREKAEAQGRLESVANNTAAILSLLRRYQALSQVHAASGKLQATLGMEPEIGSVRELSLPELTDAVRRSLKEWEDGKLPSVPNPQPEAQPTPQAEAVLPSPAPAAQAELTPPAAAPQVAQPAVEPIVAAQEEAPAAEPARLETPSPVASESAAPEPARQEAVVEAVGAVPVADDAAAGED